MSWSRTHFVEMLQTAIENHQTGQFANTIEMFRSQGDIILGDDGSFESLCANDNYIIFIYQLLDCWIDSTSHHSNYPYIQASEWTDIAESILFDMELGRIPSHIKWNYIFTLQCQSCRKHTKLNNGQFRCDQCKRNVEFRSLSMKHKDPPPNATS